jgi:hypothetical protein
MHDELRRAAFSEMKAPGLAFSRILKDDDTGREEQAIWWCALSPHNPKSATPKSTESHFSQTSKERP